MKKLDNYRKQFIVILLLLVICGFVVVRAIIEITAATATLVVSCVGLGAIILASAASLLTIVYSVLAIVGVIYLCRLIIKKVADINKS
jgi:hypothetical protein